MLIYITQYTLVHLWFPDCIDKSLTSHSSTVNFFCRRHHNSPTSKTQMPSKSIWTPYNGGSQTGSCTSIHKNAKPCTSPTDVILSIPPTTYTTTTSKQPTQPNTSRYPHPKHLKLEYSHQQDCTTSAFLHRNIRTCPRKTKHLAYTTLVRPILEYASIIWDPHTASTIHKLETVQRRSARHIMHNYSRHASVTTMLQHLDLPTLQQRRQHFKIIMLYRITHQLASILTATYITPSTRNTQHYILPYARTHVFKTSFFPSTIKIWNNLQPTTCHNL